MTEKKITKRDNFMEIRALIVKAEMLEDNKKEQYLTFIDHELKLLDKKASSKSSLKNTEEQKELMTKIVNALAEIGEPVTISDLQKNLKDIYNSGMKLDEIKKIQEFSKIAKKQNKEMATYSNQKLSAMLKKLVDNEKTVIKTIDKKKSFFSLAE